MNAEAVWSDIRIAVIPRLVRGKGGGAAFTTREIGVCTINSWAAHRDASEHVLLMYRLYTVCFMLAITSL